MRIKNPEDVAKMGLHARTQIEAALGAIYRKEAKSLPKKIEQLRASAEKPFNQSNATPSKKKKPAKIMKTADNLNYCPYPNPDPSVALHIALLKEFGSWHDGGELVEEMILPGHEVRFRFDFCLPRYKFAIEVDGFGYHRDLKSFKRDREKQKHALIKGWVVHRLTSSNIKNEFPVLLPDIKEMIKHRIQSEATIVPIGKTWCSLKE